MVECEKCELTIWLGCACNRTPASSRRPCESDYRWTRFGPYTLLISSRHMAHIPGACNHVTEEYFLNPNNGWGWISNPDPALRDRISPGHPVQPTEGDSSRAAKVRCSDCAANLGS